MGIEENLKPMEEYISIIDSNGRICDYLVEFNLTCLWYAKFPHLVKIYGDCGNYKEDRCTREIHDEILKEKSKSNV